MSRALTRAGSAASNPWTIILASVRVRAGSLREARRSSNDMSRLRSAAPCPTACIAAANALVSISLPR
jgi:hypothetical protein